MRTRPSSGRLSRTGSSSPRRIVTLRPAFACAEVVPADACIIALRLPALPRAALRTDGYANAGRNGPKTKPPAAGAAGGSLQHRMDVVQISTVSSDVKQEFFRAGFFDKRTHQAFNTYTNEQDDVGHAALFCALIPNRSRSSAALRFSKACERRKPRVFRRYTQHCAIVSPRP